MIVSAEIVALIAAAVAVFAAVLAVRATALAARTVIGAQNGSPKKLTIQVADGHTRRDLTTDTRDYAFEIAVSNPSTSEWRSNTPTLRVTYRTRANFLGAVDLTAGEPVTVPAGQSTKTTLRFSTSNVIPRHCRIDGYTLLFADSTGARTIVDASLPHVLQADSDGTGPSTWGWD
jgi:hypothetical protein